jgi:hypothetical protein
MNGPQRVFQVHCRQSGSYSEMGFEKFSNSAEFQPRPVNSLNGLQVRSKQSGRGSWKNPSELVCGGNVFSLRETSLVMASVLPIIREFIAWQLGSKCRVLHFNG